MWVNQLLMLSVRLLVNNRLLIVKFGRNQRFYVDFLLREGPASLTLVLFEGQLSTE